MPSWFRSQRKDSPATGNPQGSPHSTPPANEAVSSGAIPNQTDTPSSESFPAGIKVWVDCPNATVDICFVHGLTGDRDRTWTPKGHSDPWPKTLLPGALRAYEQHGVRARLLTFGYDAYVVRTTTASTNRLREHADNLLNNLAMERISNSSPSRPIILVAHSLGGLVCKKAILTSRFHPEDHLQDLFTNLKGVVFMGTPHRGSWMADWGRLSASALNIFKSTNASILEILQTENQLLRDIQDDFWSMIRKERESGRRIEVTCFFEELPMRAAGVVVKKESATLEGYSSFSIHANHSDMVKLGSTADDGFKKLLFELVRWARPAAASASVASECLISLAFPEMNDRVNDVNPGAKGTLNWIFTHDSYRKWIADDRCVLWVNGKPGSGKSTLLQHALSHTRDSRKSDDNSVVLSFFFHGRGTQLQKSALGLYRSLLHQILDVAPEVLTELLGHYRRQKKTRGLYGTHWSWHEKELWRFFSTAMLRLTAERTVWLFVDALDEAAAAQDNECGGLGNPAIGLVQSLLSLVEELPNRSSCRFCFTSRHYPVLTGELAFQICMEDENSDDISLFVRGRLHSLSGTRIPELIISHASNLFIWARLVVERVLQLQREGEEPERIEAEVNAVTTDLDSLYGDVFVKIRENPTSVRLFEWVGLARRPLTPEELYCAISDTVAGGSLPSQEIIASKLGVWSYGMTEIISSEGRSIVQFIHQSVKDFYHGKGLDVVYGHLCSSAAQSVGRAHYRISRKCVQYWNAESVMTAVSEVADRHDINNLRSFKTKHGQEVLLSHPLLLYATDFWGYHARESEINGICQNDILSEDYLAWPSSGCTYQLFRLQRVFLRTRKPNRHSFEDADGDDILHFLARSGLVGPIRCVLEKARQDLTLDIDPKNRIDMTPFLIAVEEGHQDLVRLFFDEMGTHGQWRIPGFSKKRRINFQAVSSTGSALAIAISRADNQMLDVLLASREVRNQYLPEVQYQKILSPQEMASDEGNQEALDLIKKYDGYFHWEKLSLLRQYYELYLFLSHYETIGFF